MDPNSKIAVVGAGSWGTAFANALSLKGLRVIIWARREELATCIHENHENPDYLPDIYLSPRLRATNDLEAAVSGAGVVVMAVPSLGFREMVMQAGSIAPASAPIISLAKGLEPGTLCRMSEVIAQEVPASWPRRIVSLSGPNLAREIALGYPSASVIACAESSVADDLQEAFMTPLFRTYSGTDIIGVELAGVLKNVVAIGAGIAQGLGFGDNARATVITRGLAESTRLAVSLGAQEATFSGMAGVGDLVATCMSPLSRNHRVGAELGRGAKIDEILSGMREVAEGVETSKSVHALAQRQGIDMPICSGVYRVIHEGQEVNEMTADLLRVVKRRESD